MEMRVPTVALVGSNLGASMGPSMVVSLVVNRGVSLGLSRVVNLVVNRGVSLGLSRDHHMDRGVSLEASSQQVSLQVEATPAPCELVALAIRIWRLQQNSQH